MHRDVNYAPTPSQWQRKGDKEEKEEDDQQRGGRGVRRQHLAPRSDTPNGGGRRSHRRTVPQESKITPKVDVAKLVKYGPRALP